MYKYMCVVVFKNGLVKCKTFSTSFGRDRCVRKFERRSDVESFKVYGGDGNGR